jgi:hypothetical protein
MLEERERGDARAVRRLVAALVLLAAIGVAAAPAEAGKRHGHKPSGIHGVVLDATCYGPCAEPQPQQPVYSGSVTVIVRRASDGTTVASRDVSDGRFRVRVRRGLYDVSSVPANPPSPPPPCPPQQVCIAEGSGSAAIVAPCETGETKRVRVRRHRFTYVELHVSNACIV